MRGDSYNNPVYVHETNYGFWWFVGMVLVWLARIVVWVVVLLGVLLGCILGLFIKRYRRRGQHRFAPLNPRLFYSDRR